MENTDVKEGILCLLAEGMGRTLPEIQEFLKLNGVKKYSVEDSEEELKGLLAEMREEGLLEERFMVDGSDTIDFAIEDVGRDFLKARGNPESKWNTGRPSPDVQKLMQQKMGSMEDME